MDKMDKEALKRLNKYYPSTRKELWFTQHSSFDFKKQLCNTDNTMLVCKTDKSFTTAKVVAKLFQDGVEIADGYFVFAKADHDFCKTKGENNA